MLIGKVCRGATEIALVSVRLVCAIAAMLADSKDFLSSSEVGGCSGGFAAYWSVVAFSFHSKFLNC